MNRRLDKLRTGQRSAPRAGSRKRRSEC
jgi:hypothetical protein